MDPKIIEGGVSPVEETPEVEVAESEPKSMDEQLEAITDGLMDLSEEGEPQPDPDPAPVEEKPVEEPEQDSPQEGPKAEPIHAPSFLNEQERADFAALPRQQQEAIVRVGKGAQTQITQTQQELAQERNRLAAMEGLYRQMQMDPNYAEHVLKGYRPVQPGQPQEVEKPHFDDPVEELKWEAKQEAIKELSPRFEEQAQQMTQFQRQVQMEQAKAHFAADPQYEEVQSAIIEHVKSLPESIGRPMYQHLDSNPQAYGEMFAHYKAQLAAKAAPEQGVQKPQPVKTQERAPILEASGPQSEPQEIAQRKANKRMKSEALRNGGLEEIGGYLFNSGLLDHLA
ncbi:protein of unknown function [Pseudodesulfovibrio profundus]|uniref:Uncharacterized protein n=1 Tax=Pseudodesulfovibrio profundus TaxID=57320 RepID=A0A2C8FEP3_9BACT|nr:hypothetical protein [Pseudodesulfovibrio profundus]SOB60636.1 protein of unknown function [Pseudodesulfovibrio profundus]